MHFIFGQRGQRHRRHELGARFGEDAADRHAAFPDQADEFGCLVSGDAAAYDQQDMFGRGHGLSSAFRLIAMQPI